MEKKKNGTAEAVAAHPFTGDEYIRVRNLLQINSHGKPSHRLRLLDYLWTHGDITSMECFDRLHNTRISSAVYDLRHSYGVPIETKTVTKKRRGEIIRYGLYYIAKEDK